MQVHIPLFYFYLFFLWYLDVYFTPLVAQKKEQDTFTIWKHLSSLAFYKNTFRDK